MFKRKLAMATLMAALAVPAFAAVVSDVKFEDRISANGTELVLNGAGLRKKLVFKVYAIGLYLPAKTDSAAAVLNSRGHKLIQLVTLRNLSAEELAEALQKGVEDNSSPADLAKIKARLDEFRGYLLAIQSVPEKSDIRIEWNGATTRVMFNGAQKGKDIPGEDFYLALLKIWFGDRPAQADLKEALIGSRK